MPSTFAVSIEEYLHTAYNPDVDYIDGELEKRRETGGETDNSRLQKLFINFFLCSREKQLGITVLSEIHV